MLFVLSKFRHSKYPNFGKSEGIQSIVDWNVKNQLSLEGFWNLFMWQIWNLKMFFICETKEH